MCEGVKKEFLEQLRFRSINQEPFVICFSGTPMSGKSTVAKVLQNRYKMVRIESDKVRHIIQKQKAEKDAVEFLKQFVSDYNEPNKRIVLDASIDRTYEDVIPIIEEKKMPYFIIRMPIPEDFNKRSKEREGQGWNEWSSKTPQQYIEESKKAEKDLDIQFYMDKDGGVKELLKILDNKLK